MSTETARAFAASLAARGGMDSCDENGDRQPFSPEGKLYVIDVAGRRKRCQPLIFGGLSGGGPDATWKRLAAFLSLALAAFLWIVGYAWKVNDLRRPLDNLRGLVAQFYRDA